MKFAHYLLAVVVFCASTTQVCLARAPRHAAKAADVPEDIYVSLADFNMAIDRAIAAEREAQAKSARTLDLAIWALRGNQCWLGTTIERGFGEFVACYVPRPYAAAETVPGSNDTDPEHCLRKAREWFESRAGQQQEGGRP